MKVIYSLREELENDPGQVADAQALTLDASRPLGLKGTYGLFGSPEWWCNIELGVAPVTQIVGVITRVYREGMHNEGRGFEMQLADGSLYKYSCVSNNSRDASLYQAGKDIQLVVLHDPLKVSAPGPDGMETDSEIVLEVSIS